MVHSAWLIRHGESTWNVLGLAQGHCDQARLTRHGEHQAWAVAAQLRGDIAVVAHGGTVRMLNACLRGIPVERMGWEPLANGCILRSPAWRLDHVTNPSKGKTDESDHTAPAPPSRKAP